MMNGGFLVGYSTSIGDGNYTRHFDGPHSTIQVAQKHFDDIKSLEPAVKDVRIYQLVYNPSNDRLF